uniref:Uncharacterized protein n=1 Tax=Rhizophora mucronata TaxID=61149 RepID=A0A2P2Q660_RHIMU
MRTILFDLNYLKTTELALPYTVKSPLNFCLSCLCYICGYYCVIFVLLGT